MTYNPDIHHRRSIRLKEYDYSNAGAYFITLCSFQRECLFGDVVTGEMRLNDIGLMVRECWQKTAAHFPYLEMDEFVVMPNHFHAIMFITKFLGAEPVGAKQVPPASPVFGVHVEKQGVYKNPGEADEAFASPLRETVRESFPMPQGTLAGSLGAVMQNFKSVSTRKINKLRQNPGCPVWQRNFYERVIRDDKELTSAREYIRNNPLQWDLDSDNPKRIRDMENV